MCLEFLWWTLIIFYFGTLFGWHEIICCLKVQRLQIIDIQEFPLCLFFFGIVIIFVYNTHWWLYTVNWSLWRPISISIVDVTVVQFTKDNSNWFPRFPIDFDIILARVRIMSTVLMTEKSSFKYWKQTIVGALNSENWWTTILKDTFITLKIQSN